MANQQLEPQLVWLIARQHVDQGTEAHHVFPDQLLELQHDAGSRGHRGLPPCGERVFGGADGGLELLARRLREPRDDLLSRLQCSQTMRIGLRSCADPVWKGSTSVCRLLLQSETSRRPGLYPAILLMDANGRVCMPQDTRRGFRGRAGLVTSTHLLADDSVNSPLMRVFTVGCAQAPGSTD